jgi:SPP1 family predicted phage head-tail adaptor
VRAGNLRWLVTIEQRSDSTNGQGNTVTTWIPFAADVPAEITPLSASELLAAAATQSDVTTRIVIRYMAGITPSMRVRRQDDGRVYNIAAPIEDNRSGREWLTIAAKGPMGTDSTPAITIIDGGSPGVDPGPIFDGGSP